MANLYIVGNGFDIDHDIKTSYCPDFKDFIEMNYEGGVENFSLEEDIDVDLWSDFENALGRIDFNHTILESKVDFESAKVGYSIMHNAKENIEKFFKKWIESIKIEKVRKYNFVEDDYFVTFNYTKTLEVIYGIKENRIWHIHGKQGGNLIFGHNEKHLYEEYLDNYHNGYDETGDGRLENELKSIANDLVMSLLKPVDRIINNDFANEIIPILADAKVNKIIVLGHSFNKVDLPYFDILMRSLQIEEFISSYYKATEKEKKEKIIKKLLVNNENINHKLLTMDEIVALSKQA